MLANTQQTVERGREFGATIATCRLRLAHGGLRRPSKRIHEMQYEAATGGDVPSLEEALKVICAHESELRAAGVRHAAIFGSVARGDAIAGSDVDVLVELDPGAHVSLFDLMGIELRLSEIFGRKVDVVSKRGLRPRLDDSILADAVSAF